jgi:hypothetical protein
MLIAGLWSWANAPRIAAYFDPPRPGVAARAVRAGAVAWIGAAELVLVFALRLVFPRRTFDRALAAALGVAAGAGLACAIAMALAAAH